MSTITNPNEYSVEGVVTSGEGKQRVIMTQTVEGSQLSYSEDSVECIVENSGGEKQRCVCVYVFSDGANNPENSTFATKTELSTGLNTKQDKLTSGAAINITSNNVVENMGVRDISTGATNGTISMNKGGSRSEVAIAGLKSAAYTNASDYATSAQGAKADTAVQNAFKIITLGD